VTSRAPRTRATLGVRAARAFRGRAPSPGHPAHRSTLRSPSCHTSRCCSCRTDRSRTEPSAGPSAAPPPLCAHLLTVVPRLDLHHPFVTSKRGRLFKRPPTPHARPCHCRPSIATAVVELHLQLAVATA
jgi:hypothetical protein